MSVELDDSTDSQAADERHDALGSGSNNTRGRAIYNISYLLESQFDFISPWRLSTVNLGITNLKLADKYVSFLLRKVELADTCLLLLQPKLTMRGADLMVTSKISHDTPSHCLFLLLYRSATNAYVFVFTKNQKRSPHLLALPVPRT